MKKFPVAICACLFVFGASFSDAQETNKSTPTSTNKTAVATNAPVTQAATTNTPASQRVESRAQTPVASGKNIRFQFDGIPYMDVIERFAQMANKPLITDTNVQGTLSFNDPN